MRKGGFNQRPRRIGIRQGAILINSDGVENEVFILDVSSSGFRLQVADLLRVGELVTLRVERESFPAKIVWMLGDEAGGLFLDPVDQFERGDANEAGMKPHDANPGGDRRTGERREDEDRREAGQRRQGSRTSDRRQGERRQGDRRE